MTQQPSCTLYQMFGYNYPAVVLLRVDPTIAPGIVAPVGSLGLYQVASVGRLYIKTGPLSTDWTLNS
jgi:hypothetical protein